MKSTLLDSWRLVLRFFAGFGESDGHHLTVVRRPIRFHSLRFQKVDLLV